MSAESTDLFRHLLALSDDVGVFEHAEGTVPRRDHGYCVDDVARALIALTRQDDGARGETDPELTRLSRTCLTFLLAAQADDGSFVNRRDAGGTWRGEPAVEDAWGRALWALGTAASSSRDPDLVQHALPAFTLGASQRTHWPRSMAFAGLGAAEVLHLVPEHAVARRLLADAVATIGPLNPDPAWPWPWQRLEYADAVVAELLIAAGERLGDGTMVRDGLRLLDWLLTLQIRDGHLSVTPVGGRDRGDHGPGFDQQPVEVSTLADACARAHDVSAEPGWADAVLLAQEWFLGANDVGVALVDPVSGGCRDGLMPTGANENQGAESTLAMITTTQHARRLVAARS
ncbi:MAG: hypothetical protein U0Q15_04545 [Kineosporiaceae bacterium]